MRVWDARDPIPSRCPSFSSTTGTKLSIARARRRKAATIRAEALSPAPCCAGPVAPAGPEIRRCRTGEAKQIGNIEKVAGDLSAPANATLSCGIQGTV
jgi:hypothetical protein